MGGHVKWQGWGWGGFPPLSLSMSEVATNDSPLRFGGRPERGKVRGMISNQNGQKSESFPQQIFFYDPILFNLSCVNIYICWTFEMSYADISIVHPQRLSWPCGDCEKWNEVEGRSECKWGKTSNAVPRIFTETLLCSDFPQPFRLQQNQRRIYIETVHLKQNVIEIVPVDLFHDNYRLPKYISMQSANFVVGLLKENLLRRFCGR